MTWDATDNPPHKEYNLQTVNGVCNSDEEAKIKFGQSVIFHKIFIASVLVDVLF